MNLHSQIQTWKSDKLNLKAWLAKQSVLKMKPWLLQAGIIPTSQKKELDFV